MNTKKQFYITASLVSCLVIALFVFFNKEETISLSVKEPSSTKTSAPEGTKTVNLKNDATLTWIKDNKGTNLLPRSLFSDASDSLFASLNMPEGIPASISTFLLKADKEYILFDAGLGSSGGETLIHLKELGVSPDSIKKVYLTHMHFDHINGLISDIKKKPLHKIFKNAEIFLEKKEHDFWLKENSDNGLQKAVITLYQDKINLFSFGDTLPHNVIALDASGHTPGHTAFQIENYLIIGDLIHGYALQINHPEINSNYDMNKPKSAECRKRLFKHIEQNNLTMIGMHLPEPGFMK